MRLLAVLLAAVAVTAQEPLDRVLEKMHSYLEEYETQISDLIAAEEMTQTYEFPTRASGTTSTWRKLRSEIAFMRLPGNGPWLGYRNVRTVDNKPVSEKEQPLLMAMLPGGEPDYDRALKLANESSRFNLGNARTTNVPTLPLELMHRRHRDRFKFRVQSVERLRGRRLRKLRFEEVHRPTLIQTPDGGDILSRGTIWIEEETGRVFEAEVRSVDATESRWRNPPESILRVSFTPHAALNMLVPDRMTERFPIGRQFGSGEARYSDFRKFTTSARIVPE